MAKKYPKLALLGTCALCLPLIANAEMVGNGKAAKRGSAPSAKQSPSTTKINGVTYENAPSKGAPTESGAGSDSASLTPELSLRIKKIFIFPSIDDISGIVAPKLDAKLNELFLKNSRFNVVRDPQVLKALSPDELSYPKVAQNQAVHREAARVTGTDTTVLLRTHNVGSDTEMTLELRDANGELLYSESGTIPGYSSMEARWGLIQQLFETTLKKIPFDGSVTGRTVNTVTLDLGAGKVMNGDELEIVRIVSVQRHPLLRTLVGTDYVRVGRVKVTNVDRALSFANVVEEFPGESITSGNKLLTRGKLITQHVDANPEEKKEIIRGGEKISKPQEDPTENLLRGDFDKPKPRYGYVGANLFYGSLSHSQRQSGNQTDVSGAGLGGGLDGELWVTRNWIANVAYYIQKASLSGNGLMVGDTTWNRFEGFAGYRFIPTGTDGLAVSGFLGYQTQKFDIPSVGTVAGRKYSGVALKIEADVPFLNKNRLTTGFGFQPFSTMTELATSLGTPDGGNVIFFHLDWNYQVADLIWARLGVNFDSASGSYIGATSSVTNKRFSIGPGLYYSF